MAKHIFRESDRDAVRISKQAVGAKSDQRSAVSAPPDAVDEQGAAGDDGEEEQHAPASATLQSGQRSAISGQPLQAPDLAASLELLVQAHAEWDGAPTAWLIACEALLRRHDLIDESEEEAVEQSARPGTIGELNRRLIESLAEARGISTQLDRIARTFCGKPWSECTADAEMEKLHAFLTREETARPAPKAETDEE